MPFFLYLISRMRPAVGGSRFGIVLDGSLLFAGGVGSDESEICRNVLMNDLVEVILGLRTGMFDNTGIRTSIGVDSNRESVRRKGKL